MNRPSRGDRLSATTTRHTGSFLPPTRVSLIATATDPPKDSRKVRAGRLATAHQLAEVRHLALREALHELAHLAELLDELVDLLDRGAGAVGDAGAAAALDDVRPAALLRRHRQDDRLDAVELLLVDLELGELVAGEPGH